MFLLADLVELVRHPFAALHVIDGRRRLADGLIALGLSITLPAAIAELAALGPYRPPANLGSLPSLTAQGADIYPVGSTCIASCYPRMALRSVRFCGSPRPA